MAPIRRRLIRLAALLGSALAIAGCSLIEPDNAPLTTFDPAGPFSRQEDSLFWLVFWIATGVFVIVMGGLVFILFRFRDRHKDPDAKEPKQTHGSPTLEVLWTVIPALILAGIAVPTVSSVFELTKCADDAMQVDVLAHQWWFEFQYPEYGFSTASIMVIPAGREVCAEMTSADVIHNFWVPALNGKRYLIPGQTTNLRLEADEPGEYWAHCAEFCGLSHSLMRARVVAMTEDDFQQWAAGQVAPTPLPAEGTPEYAGYQVYLNKGCTQCHTVRFDDDTKSNVIPTDSFHGPELTHFGTRHVFAGAALPEQGEQKGEALKRWLADPPNVKPGSYMPNLALTEEEIDSVITWLESNK